MGHLPTIKVTKSGKRYFVVHGRKIFISAKMTKNEILAIYKLLLNTLNKKKKKLKQKGTNNVSAQAVIKQYINSGPVKAF